MTDAAASHSKVLRRLHELMRRMHSSGDLQEILDEVAQGVHEVLGYGVAAISRLEGDHLVMTSVAAEEKIRGEILGQRNTIEEITREFDLADQWGVLRFLPHDRRPGLDYGFVWVPDLEVSDLPGAWHPLDTLYAPLWSASGQLLGVVSVDLPPDGLVPGVEARELLEMFVVQAGLAVDAAARREVLAAQVRTGEMLRAVSTAGALADLDLTLADAGRAVAVGLGTERVWIRCFTSGSLDVIDGSHVYPPTVPSQPDLVAVAARLARQSAARGHPILFGPEDLATDDGHLPQGLRDLDIGAGSDRVPSMLIAAVGSEREVVGYLAVARDAGTRWTQHELDSAMEVGRTLGRVVLDRRLYDRERHLVAELQEIDRYRGELIATISHELKTPLSSIIGHAELMGEVDTGLDSVEAIARNARRLGRLVQGLLDYSAVQQPRVRERRPVDLARIVEASREVASFQAAQADVTVTVEAPAEPVTVSVDPDELATVVDNLVGNAVKYTRPGGAVTLAVGRARDHVWITCTDNGIGISTADQAQLFAAFQRSSNPEALSIAGSGLGLAISRRIVQLHGGQLTVRSTIGEGSTFRVQLPLETH